MAARVFIGCIVAIVVAGGFVSYRYRANRGQFDRRIEIVRKVKRCPCNRCACCRCQVTEDSREGLE